MRAAAGGAGTHPDLNSVCAEQTVPMETISIPEEIRLILKETKTF